MQVAGIAAFLGLSLISENGLVKDAHSQSFSHTTMDHLEALTNVYITK